MKLLQIIISTFVFIVQFTIVSASPVPLCKDGSRMFNHEVSALISRNAPQYRLHELEHYGKSEDNKYDCYYTYLGPIEHAAVIIYFDDEKIYAKKIKVKWLKNDKLAAIAASHAMTAIQVALDIQRPELIILGNRMKESNGGGAVWCPNLRKTFIAWIAPAPEDARYNTFTIVADDREIM